MASLLFLAFLLSINGLLISDSLLAFANQNPNNYLICIAVYTFIFFLVPFEFISATILLLFHVAIPQSAFFINHLTMATRFLVSTTLFVGVPLIVHITFTDAVGLDILTIMLIGATTAAAVAIVLYKYNPFKRYFNSAGQTVSISVPVFTALCISMGTFLSFFYQNHENPFMPVPIQLFLLTLNCVNFVLAMVLLFLYISVPTEGPQTSIPAVLVDFLVEAVLAMSFTTTVLIGFYMVVALAPLAGPVLKILGPGAGEKFGLFM